MELSVITIIVIVMGIVHVQVGMTHGLNLLWNDWNLSPGIGRKIECLFIALLMIIGWPYKAAEDLDSLKKKVKKLEKKERSR